jgi:aromatic ring-opening dioxygenase catalytic subunit (LigB family)
VAVILADARNLFLAAAPEDRLRGQDEKRITEQNSFTEALSALSGGLPHPTGIIEISAHWEMHGIQEAWTAHPRTLTIWEFS